MTYFTSDVLSASVYQFVFICGTKRALQDKIKVQKIAFEGCLHCLYWVPARAQSPWSYGCFGVCGHLTHEPKCFPLLLLPTASVTALAQDMQGNPIAPCAYTSHAGHRSGVKGRDFPKKYLLWLQAASTCHVALLP